MASTPYSIIAGPADVYVAAVATSFPDMDDTPSASWTLLGRTEGGVTITHNETIELLRVEQASGPVKAIRTEESLVVAFNLAEITVERYAKVLNDVAVTDTAPGASPGNRNIPLRMGFEVSRFALLVIGPSPYGNWYLHFEVPIVVQTGSPAITITKDDKSILPIEFTAIEDPSASTAAERFGVLRAQDE